MAKDKKSKKGQEEGGEEEVKVQPGKDSVNDDAGNAKQGGGKKAKRNRKKDDWEDDVAKELEALSLESKGGKNTQDEVEEESLPEKKQKEKTRGKADPSNENVNEENVKGKQSKKQKGKKGKVEESDDDESISTGKGGKKASIVSDDEEISVKDNKKTKGKKANVHDSDEEDSLTQRKVKGKKKGKGIDSDDESIDTGKNQKGKKKGQKGKDVSDDEMDIVNDSKSSKRKGKKNQEILSDDEGLRDVDQMSNKQKPQKGRRVHFVEDTAPKKSKGKKGKTMDSDDEQDKSTKPLKPKSGFQLLEMDDMDIDDDDDDLSGDESPVEVKTKQKKQPDKSKPKVEDEEMDVVAADVSEVKKDTKGAKKSKKKERKRKDDDDEDVDKILEELAMEMEGKKAPEKPKEEPKEKSEEVSVTEDVKSSEAEEQSKKKKKKKKAADSEAVTSEKPADDDAEPPADEGAEQTTVKTAAQKKKEKKERERMKKLAQNEQERGKSTKGDISKEQKAETVEPKLPEEEEPQPMDEDKAEEDEADDKKKKKKKKKGEEEEKKDKKRPGKKAIAAMQEALKKVKEEEERLKKEEEERQRAAEEAERLRQEKLRLEQEKKEKKKQKEKEKRERLKAEGKLLNKSQRQARARMEATLQALRQQGVEVPQIGEKVGEKKPRLGDRKRTPRKKEEEKKDVTPEVKVEIVVEPQKPEESEPQDNKELPSEEWVAGDDVKDAWDETSSGEETEKEAEQQEEEEKEKPPQKSEKPIVVVQVKKQESVEESDETSESEESSSEEESESEEESSDDSEDDGRTQEEKVRERATERIRKRREEAEKNRTVTKLRSPVVCVLGHVDTGKTKILDKIRRTHVQDSEAGGITQQIGATMVPQEALKEKCKMVKSFSDMELKVPGLLIIDTPGHESFSNLRSRGSSLCDIAVLVVDIMHGLEQQTIESINLLKAKKTPFIVALNKIDRLYEWKAGKNKDVQDVIKNQARNTKMEFDKRTKEIIVQFAEQGLNTTLYYENTDRRSWISMVPTSAHTGDGMGNLLALIVELTQTMMTKRIAFSEELQATVLEVKAIPGLGTTIDVILVNGRLREGDSIVLAGHDGAMATQIRALLMPQPLKELRVKNPYEEFKEVEGAQGVKIAGKDLDKAIAGLQLLVAHHPDEIEILKEEVNRSLQDAMNAIKLAERGVYVQASTLGSLEALLEFLKVSKVPCGLSRYEGGGASATEISQLRNVQLLLHGTDEEYSGIRIGPVVKKDVMKASIMLEHDSQYAVILAFDVKIERDAQELADSLGVRIFQADIIYNLFDRFMEYREELKNKKREEFKNIAVFPCKLRILPQFVFNSRDPIVVGVVVEAGVVKDGTPLCVPSKEFLDIGTVSTIEINHKPVATARKGQEVCIKIEPNGGEAPKMFGRHFDHTDMLVSKISRQSIDACKEYFRDDLQKTDWQLMVELKKTFQIL